MRARCRRTGRSPRPRSSCCGAGSTPAYPGKATPSSRRPRRARRPRLVVAATDPPAGHSRCQGSGLGAQPDRRLHPGRAGGEGPGARAGGGSTHLRPPRDVRPDRAAADAGGDRRLSQGRFAGRLREAGGPAAGPAGVRRALGPPLAGRGPLRREPRLRDEHAAAQRLALPRLRHPGVQRGSALSAIRPGAAGRRRGRQGRPAHRGGHRLPGRRPARPGRQRHPRGPAATAHGRHGGHGFAHGGDVPRPDRRLRPLPRPQVRPDLPEGFLRDASGVRRRGTRRARGAARRLRGSPPRDRDAARRPRPARRQDRRTGTFGRRRRRGAETAARPAAPQRGALPSNRGPFCPLHRRRHGGRDGAVHRRAGGVRPGRPGRRPGPGQPRRQGVGLVGLPQQPLPHDRPPHRRPRRQQPELDLQRARQGMGAGGIAQGRDHRPRRLGPRPRAEVRRPSRQRLPDRGFDGRRQVDGRGRLVGPAAVRPRRPHLRRRGRHGADPAWSSASRWKNGSRPWKRGR